MGYRLIDEAACYANEKECGQGIKRAIDEGIVKREDLWVTSKLWNTCHRKEHVKLACQKTLSDLGLDYVDLYLIHFPVSLRFIPFEKAYPHGFSENINGEEKMFEDEVSIAETWAAMEELVKEGLVKNIGVSNFNIGLCRELMYSAKIKPAVNQVELHPYLCQETFLRFCAEKDIKITAYSSLGAGSYVPVGQAEVHENALEEQCIKDIASKHGKSPAQVALRWALQRNTAIIPKSNNVERIKENMAVFDFNLSDDEMKTISALDKHRRFNDPTYFTQKFYGGFYPIYE